MQRNDSVSAVIAAITDAFSNEPPTTPREALVHEDTWETNDLLDSLAAIEDRPDRTFIERHAYSLPAFTPAGLRHVLPHYLIYSLQHPRSDVTERVIFELSPTHPESDWYRDRITIFSPAQKKTICKFIRHMQSELAGEHYDDDLLRALVVWGCG